jgi:ankyrin repeat protein
MKKRTLLKNSNYGTALVASTCLILLSPLTGHAQNADKPVWTAAGEGDLKTLTALVESDTRLAAAQDRYGMLPLQYAAAAGQIETMKFLLAHGADIMARDNRGWTALHHAVNNKHVEAMELLSTYGATVDARNTMQWTPLHLAVLKEDKTMVLALIKRGADVDAKTSRNLTPYNLAVDNGKREIADQLVAVMVDKVHQEKPIMVALSMN